MRNFPRRGWFAATLMVLCAAPAVRAGTVFNYDFETGLPAEFSGAGAVEASQGLQSQTPSFGSYFLRNSTAGPALATRLTLTGLSSHTYIHLSFMLAILDSWDGLGNDYFNVNVDGVTVLTSQYNNFNMPDHAVGDMRFYSNDIYHDPAVSPSDPGYPGWADSGFLIDLNIPHTTSSATIDFFASGPGWDGGDDESWGIDNLQASAQTPEPSAIVLLLSGGLGIVALRRRKK